MNQPIEVTLYTRDHCSLCDAAKGAIRAAQSLYRLDVDLVEKDIDAEPLLRARFNDDVPVVYIAGVEAFRHRLTPEAFAEAVRSGAPARGLASESCVPCRGGVPALKGTELDELAREIPGWTVVNEHHLERAFTFPDFATALSFTNGIGALAEREGHHPDIHLAWGKVRVEIWTHAIDGLTRSDFVLAAKIDGMWGA